MKDSSVDWIGKIPSEWNVVAIKRVTKFVTCGVASTPEYVAEEMGVLFLSAQNIKKNRIDLSNKAFIPIDLHRKLTKYRTPQEGDVLQVRVGAKIGDTAIVDILDEFSVYVSLSHIRVDSKFNNKYFAYCIGADLFIKEAFQFIDSEGSQGNLNVQTLRNMKIPYPNIKEQSEISLFLDEKCSKIDSIIEDKQKQLEKISDFKNSLIYEYVTGKKRVGQGDANE